MRLLVLTGAAGLLLACTVACTITSTAPSQDVSPTNPPDQSKLPAVDASKLGGGCSGFGTSVGDTVAFSDADCPAGYCLVDARKDLDLYCSADCSKVACPTGYLCQATTLGSVSFACFKDPNHPPASSSSSSSSSSGSSGGGSSSSGSSGSGSSSSSSGSTSSSSGGSSSSSSSSSSSGSSGSSSGGTGDAVCDAKPDNASCTSCCDTNHPTGSNTANQAFATCVCQASVCGTPCQAECGGSTTLTAACNTCINATTTTSACQASVQNACQADADCVAWSKCSQACPK